VQPAEVCDARTVKRNLPHALIFLGAQMQRQRRVHHAASQANMPLLPAVSVHVFVPVCRVWSGCAQYLP
jgi:hypothetical protein